MTALYDVLYVAVSKISMQTGAKCVMAFTDGYDNYSTRTVDANKRDQAINHDNMGDSEEFNRWGRFALDEARQVYSDAMQVIH